MAYICYFNDEAMHVDDYIDQAALQAVMNKLQPSSFKWEMSKRMSKSFIGFMKKAQKHIRCLSLIFY